MYLVGKNLCSGCHACFNACPKNCIDIKPDKEGFLQPVIDKSKCIDCGKCRNVCPILSENKKALKGRAFACISKNDNIRERSSSGGMFTLLAEHVIEQGGVVFGAAFDKNFNVHHIAVNDKEELHKLRGSKYVQSKIGSAYKEAKKYLDQGICVLFAGTPCQISGLKSYLGKKYETLITQDLVCHGVPSPKAWQNYIEFREKKAGSSTCKVNFRNKQNGWKSYYVRFEFVNGTTYEQFFGKDLFMQGFLANLFLRNSCYDCRSKGLERESDITLADFWGVEKVVPDMFDDKGTSLVFVNTAKGQALFDKISAGMEHREVDINEAVLYNSAANTSVHFNEKRKIFFRYLNRLSFDENIYKCQKTTFTKKVYVKVKKILKAFIVK